MAHSIETKRKISIAQKKRFENPEARKKMSDSHRGMKASLAARKKMSIKRTGSKNGNWKGGISKDSEYIAWSKHRYSHQGKTSGGFHTYGEWQLLKKQYNNTCPCCHRSEPDIQLTMDHIIPVSKGGSNLIENYQPLCIVCNMKKHNRIIKY